jgi:hypothetical protein
MSESTEYRLRVAIFVAAICFVLHYFFHVGLSALSLASIQAIPTRRRQITPAYDVFFVVGVTPGQEDREEQIVYSTIEPV